MSLTGETYGVGHNSRLAELETELNQWKERALRAESERDISNTKLGRISRIYQRDDISPRAKSIATAVIVGADINGHARFSANQLRMIASSSDQKSARSATSELESIRLLSVEKASGSQRTTMFSLLPDEDLLEAVEAYRASAMRSTPVRKTDGQEAGGPLAGRKTDSQLAAESLDVRKTSTHTDLWQAEKRTPSVVASRKAREKTATYTDSQSGSTPPHPPLSPHTPLSPPIIPPFEKEISLESSPRRSEFVAEREARGGGVFTDPGLIASCRALGIELSRDIISHRDFTINLQVAYLADLQVPKTTAANAALSLALQWATEIASGKPAATIVPKFIASVVRRAVQKSHVNGAVDASIIERASKSPPAVPYRHNGSPQARNWRDA